MTRSAIVLGAGMVGTCAAWHLVRRGWSVVLLDRRHPGEETSFGNAGLIQREAVQPYAFPREWGPLSDAALGRGAAVNYHVDALPQLAPRLLRYFQHSGPARYPQAVAAHSRLIAHSLTEHAPMIEAAGAADLVQKGGYLQVFRTPAARDAAWAAAQGLSRDHGIAYQTLDTDALARAEPALRLPLAGALHWTDPWAVRDPGELVSRYARSFQGLGGRFVTGDAATLRQQGSGWRVDTTDGPTDAQHAVIALGPWAESVLQPLGYELPLFVKRGYHRHYRGPGPSRPVFDLERGYVLAPMVRGTRLTTGAEFAERDAPATPRQLARAEACARELFPLPEPVEAQPWLGARPCTPDMLPVIGAAPRHAGLWFDFGHAHQGFTLGPVSGRLLAELMEGDATVVDAGAYSPVRFLGD